MTLAAFAIIGAGPSGLAAAGTLAEAGHSVSVFERNARPGRKFLLAGRGGLNLTHSEPQGAFLARYGAAKGHLRPAIDAFPPEALRDFASSLGEETFVGTSGRVFPKSFKASPLLRAWLRRLEAQGVALHARHLWGGIGPDGALLFDTPDGPVERRFDATLLALGGASWPKLGSDGGWVRLLGQFGVAITPLHPANCGFDIAWSAPMRAFAGTPLKRIAASFGGKTVRGEAMVTEDGLEGGAIYALARDLREAIHSGADAMLILDLRPDMTMEDLSYALFDARKGDSLTSRLRKKAGLPPVSIALMREACANHVPTAPDALARLIKAAPLRLTAARPLDRAISTAGGIALDEIGPDFQLKLLPGLFAAGEMLDWEAPTGGYLLQACFSTGVAAAKGMMASVR